MKKTALLTFACLPALAACGSLDARSNLVNAQYWERANASSAIYLDGPKSQQMLQRDIAFCVSSVRELERLGAVKKAIPGDVEQPNLTIPDPGTPQGALEAEETPRRDHYLYEEYYDYHDFESCMKNKGWQRVQYLPYDRANQSRLDYVGAINGQAVDTLNGDTPPPPPRQDSKGDFSALNH